MKHLYTFRKMPNLFRSLVLAFALVLVGCGGDADEPTATAVIDSDQDAVPTAPAPESTPDTQVSEDEIVILEPQISATPDSATPDTDEVVAASPVDESDDVVQEDEDEAGGIATPEAVEADEPVEASPQVPVDEVDPEDAVDDASDEEAATQAERVRTGNETFDHPGDGTGGSGMPGERDSVDEEEIVSATPVASPVAQLSIAGCDVPDVPGFLGDDPFFRLTADVNFRSGPGVECEPALDEPVGEGQVVEVIGGPVTQADDGSEWVQIEINGEPGWITTEFIEPVE